MSAGDADLAARSLWAQQQTLRSLPGQGCTLASAEAQLNQFRPYPFSWQRAAAEVLVLIAGGNWR